MSAMLTGITRRHQGSRIRAAQKGIGTFVTLDIDRRIPCASPARGAVDQGALHVWLQYCDWTIRFGSGERLSSTTAHTRDDRLLATLEGCRFETISLSPCGLGIDIGFSGGVEVRARPNLKVYDRGDDLLTVFDEGHAPVAFSPTRGVYREDGTHG